MPEVISTAYVKVEADTRPFDNTIKKLRTKLAASKFKLGGIDIDVRTYDTTIKNLKTKLANTKFKLGGIDVGEIKGLKDIKGLQTGSNVNAATGLANALIPTAAVGMLTDRVSAIQKLMRKLNVPTSTSGYSATSDTSTSTIIKPTTKPIPKTIKQKIPPVYKLPQKIPPRYKLPIILVPQVKTVQPISDKAIKQATTKIIKKTGINPISQLDLPTTLDTAGISKASKNFANKIRGGLKGIGGMFKSIGKGALYASAGVYVLSRGIKTLWNTMNDFSEDAEIFANLEAVLASTGNTTGFTTTKIKDMAAQLQKVTNFSDEAGASALASLAGFGKISGKEFERAFNVAADLSQVMGTDIKNNANLIGKALSDPIRGMKILARGGYAFSSEEESIIKNYNKQNNLLEAQDILLKKIEERYGGAAKTVVNPIKQINNLMSEVRERAGQFIADIIGIGLGWDGVKNKIQDAINRFDEFRKTKAYLELVAKIQYGAKVVYYAIELIVKSMIVLAKAIGPILEKAGFALGWLLKPLKGISTEYDKFTKKIEGADKAYQEQIKSGKLPDFIAKGFAVKEKAALKFKKAVEDTKRSLMLGSGAESMWDLFFDAWIDNLNKIKEVDVMGMKLAPVGLAGVAELEAYQKKIKDQEDMIRSNTTTSGEDEDNEQLDTLHDDNLDSISLLKEIRDNSSALSWA